MTKFSEVAHLYLGCEIIGSFRLEPRKGYLTGITNGGEDVEIQFFEEDGINVFESPEYNAVDEIKPILRHLSDMTEDEMKELLIKWYYPSEDMFMRLSDSIKFYPNRRTKTTKVIEGIAYSLYKDGNHKATGTLSFTRLNPVQTLYLLKQGFDLFRLIEKGEAIDKTKI